MYRDQRRRIYNIDWREYFPSTLRWLAYPSLALLFSADSLISSEAGERFVVIRVVGRVHTTSHGGEALLHAFTDAKQPTYLVLQTRQVTGEKRWFFREFNVSDSFARQINAGDSLSARLSPLLGRTAGVEVLRNGQVVGGRSFWLRRLFEITLLLFPGLVLVRPSLLKNPRQKGEILCLVGAGELFALGYWLYLLGGYLWT